MQFCIAKKHKLSARPQSATPKLRRPIRVTNSPQIPNFCSYFFGEDKECQTLTQVTPSYRVSVCQKFLKSHRNSIEREVVSIFREQSIKDKGEETADITVSEEKNGNLKDLLKHARVYIRPVNNLEIKLPISVSKAKINRKLRIVSCNKYFGTPKRPEHFFQIMSPKLKDEKEKRRRSVGKTKVLKKGKDVGKVLKINLPDNQNEVSLDRWKIKDLYSL